ncbi:polyribonucleotide nucleotidyltransferase 1, mitochondrial-like [Oppia nitens]|uniref:polyribonucleotide nucleotidyltransferase 1, mitochondrial-like n=1 Tax=Oppia nitens TaxID=1686743 RepID=UPI0023DB69B0|nr:polyribonucleotide nucleotidyltransferase 1, mitochondrial-like [Oppia nitens]
MWSLVARLRSAAAVAVKSQPTVYCCRHRKWPPMMTTTNRYVSSGSGVGQQQQQQQQQPRETHVKFSNGRTMSISSGRFARLADGSAVVSAGDTNVMVVAVSRRSPKGSYAPFVPLTVDYRHKYSAAGRIPTNHLRREMGATEREILTARLIDRSIRPLFPKGYNFETQLVCNLLSVDAVNDPDVLAINSASAALSLSDIPWNGPVGAVRVALTRDRSTVITCPTRKEMADASLNCVVTCNSAGNVLMLEAFANEPIVEPDLLKTLHRAVKECKVVCNQIETLQRLADKPKRDISQHINVFTDELFASAKVLIDQKVREVFTDYSHDKFSRDRALESILTEARKQLKDQFADAADDDGVLNDCLHHCIKRIYAEVVDETGKRCDGRLAYELRPISCSVDLFRPLHGSALFQRGFTQVLCSLTFDSLDSAWRSDAFSALTGGLKEKNFMLHYEFPQYATNATGSTQVGRREIGHGSLAERSIRPVVPNDYPFTIRLNCEVLESNGSSSMASVCAGSLALMDAGVDISSATAGVAMGLIKNGDQYSVLTDIMGFEDFFGEMDFKIAGTKKAFTGLQLDCKLTDGLPFPILVEAIQKAGIAKHEILNIMNGVIREPRISVDKPNRPVTETVDIPVHKRPKVFGYGGYNVKKLTDELGIRLTQHDDDLTQWSLFAPNRQSLYEAKDQIQELMDTVSEPVLEFGQIYTAKIVELRENGVLVQLYPTQQTPALLHVSQLDIRKVSHPSALDLDVGQEIEVKYFGRDPVSGAMRLSRKVLQSADTFKRNLIREKAE